jgi:hypothetical protein
MPRYLTKSRFKLAIECPTKLFYSSRKSIYKDNKQEDSFLRMLADGGFQVGQLAKVIFKDGHEIKSKDAEKAEAETLKLLTENEEIVLLEPAIRYKNFFVRIDVLIKRKNTFELIEVKAKSYNSAKPEVEGAKGGILKPMLPYIQDVAFQKFVLQLAFPDSAISTYLMLPDKAVTSEVDGLNQMFKVDHNDHSTKVVVDEKIHTIINEAQKLLIKVSVDKYVDDVLNKEIECPGLIETLPNLAEHLAKAYESDQKIAPTLSSACSKCEFKAYPTDKLNSGFHECLGIVSGWQGDDLYQATILDIWDFRKKDPFLAQGIYKPSQLSQDDIGYKDDKEGLSRTQRQWLQCQGIPPEDDLGGFYLDTELFNHHMTKWKYPFHMIDFETSTTALPFFKGMRPYESVAFQFSHHIIYEDGSIKHLGEFILAEAGQFPNYEFVRALKKELDIDDGTVFRWAAHENTILNHIATQLINDQNPPSDRAALLQFIDTLVTGGSRAMVDLNEIAKRTYYHPDTKARTSIKKVLPAVLKSSAYLKEKYTQPIYGKEIQSLNFQNFTWWQSKDGQFVEPYDLLKDIENEMLGDEGAEIFDTEDDGFEIAEGGAAAAAFARLQFESLTEQQRSNIKNALLRYCELDTLAMVMIVEAWREWSS